MKIVFFGTPEFAVPSLRALTGEGFAVDAVVTQPDRPRDRSRSRLLPSAVKEVAAEEGIPVLQPSRPSEVEFIETLEAMKPDLGVVVAYGHILKPEVLEIPRSGMVNVHASLLPELRGAAPIQHAIRLGLNKTGITIMKMDEGMDSGPILHQVDTEIADDETSGELAVNLAEIGALALVEALAFWAADELEPVEQDHSKATFAPKVTRDTARIDWSLPSREVSCHIRAMDPAPGSWTELDSKAVKMFGPRPSQANQGVPGTVVATGPGITIATGDGAVEILEVQPEGRRRMQAADWCLGAGPGPGTKFD